MPTWIVQTINDDAYFCKTTPTFEYFPANAKHPEPRMLVLAFTPTNGLHVHELHRLPLHAVAGIVEKP